MEFGGHWMDADERLIRVYQSWWSVFVQKPGAAPVMGILAPGRDLAIWQDEDGVALATIDAEAGTATFADGSTWHRVADEMTADEAEDLRKALRKGADQAKSAELAKAWAAYDEAEEQDAWERLPAELLGVQAFYMGLEYFENPEHEAARRIGRLWLEEAARLGHDEAAEALAGA